MTDTIKQMIRLRGRVTCCFRSNFSDNDAIQLGKCEAHLKETANITYKCNDHGNEVALLGRVREILNLRDIKAGFPNTLEQLETQVKKINSNCTFGKFIQQSSIAPPGCSPNKTTGILRLIKNQCLARLGVYIKTLINELF